MHHSNLFMAIILLISICVSPLSAASREKMWAEVDKAVNDGLPQTAIEKLDPIIKSAVADKKVTEAARAICKKIVLEGNIQGNKAEEKIVRLEKEIETADPSIRPLLRIVLARWYWHYFQQNNWRFLDRTQTAGLDEKDFTTWDLPKLFLKIGSLYESVLADETALQALPFSDLGEIVDAGNQPADLWPTVFDFYGHQALEFYTSGEQAGVTPQEAFEIDAASPVLDDAKTFAAWNVVATDTNSPKFRALRIYQRLLIFHLAKVDISALIDLDLQRLRWANNAAMPNGRSDRYIAQLKAIAAEYTTNPLSALALAMCAEELQSRGQKKEAWKIAKEGCQRFPASDGGVMCQGIINAIEAKQLQIDTERVSNNPTALARISWCNIDQVHFRLIDISDRELFRANGYDPESFSWDEVRGPLSQKPAAEWKTELEPTPDYNAKAKTIEFPKVKPGFYMLYASWKPDFSEGNNAIRYTPVWVTKLGLVVRNRNGVCDGVLADNETGKPIGKGKITAYTFNYDKGWKRQVTVETDAEGAFRFDQKLDNVALLVKAEGEQLLYNGRYSSWERSGYTTDDRVFFFTDRGLYRPGQTIQFKAICVRIDHEKNRYEVLPDRAFTVSFRDVNGEEVSKTELSTNDFGSCSGSFTAPTGRLTGTMSLQAVGINGSTNIQVEEYKRPKFKVTLDVPAEAAKLGEEVVLTGLAQSYTMAAVDGADVKFRVVREAMLPPWCWWYVIPAGSNQEIAHGKLVTDAQGRFTIRFQAKPDTSIPEENQPVFTYRVSADVTDSAGETRSQSLGIRIGYTALELGVSSPAWIHAGKAFNVSLSSKTLDGKGIPTGGKVTVNELKSPEKMPRSSCFPWEAGTADPTNVDTWENGKQISSADFNTSVDGTGVTQITLPAGIYRVTATARDRFNKEVVTKHTLVVVDPAASSWNVREPSRFTVQNAGPDVGDTFRALWSTGYAEGQAFVEIEHRRTILKKYWTPEGQTQHLIEVPVTEDLRGGFTVRVTYFRENRVYLHQQMVYVPWSNKKLDLSFAHFSSKLQPGQEDTWTITVKGPEAEAQAIELVAAMYDASLDAFLPFDWMRGFSFFYSDYSSADQTGSNMQKRMNSLTEDWNVGIPGVYRQYPQLKRDIVTNFMGYMMSRAKGLSFADSEMMPQAMCEGAAPPCPAAAPMEMNMAREEKSAMSSIAGGAPAASKDKSLEPAPAKPAPDLDKVSARANLNETAFFFPQLITNEKNEVSLKFTVPEALTTWKFLGFAHGKNCQSGGLTAETVTQKDLMVQPNPPRFLREGDVLAFTAKVTNMTDKPLEGRARMTLSDPATGADRSADYGLKETEQSFSVPAKESRTVAWTLNVPDGAGVIAYKVVGAAGNVSDGEENVLPVLSRRILVREALPLPIRGPATKAFKLQKLIDSAGSKTLKTESLTVQMTSNPAWYAVQALPYLMEFPHECAEQMFNRLYANSLARFIAASDPKIKKVFDTWKADEAYGGKALLSNLEKNEELKNVLLIETPWVREAKSETEAKHRIGMLFDANRIESEVGKITNTLSKMQFNDGSWPWFPGGRPDSFITLYIATGFGRLRHLGVDIDVSMGTKAWNHLDAWIDEIYRDILRYGHKNDNNLSPLIAFYFYGRSFFLKDIPVPGSAREAFDYFRGQAEKYWLDLNSRLAQGHLALGLHRIGDTAVAKKIMASMKERSVSDEELGRFWRDTELAFSWFHAPIETQAIMIEAFDEVMNDQEAVEDCKVWLLKQKQTQDWKTTKATADAVYSLLLKGADLLASDKLVKVEMGGQEVKPEKVEAGTGFYEKRWAGSEVKPEFGDIKVTKEDKGVAWGGLHWQYLEDMSRVTPHETNLKLKKTLFLKADSPKGPVITPIKPGDALAVGDLMTVRIELRTDRDLEYVHMKDQRGSGMEPTEVLSQYRYQDGLGYYQSTKDTATHFFFDYLPKGTYVFEYTLRVQHRGTYQSGMAEIQCMYAPEFGSHSESFVMTVK